MTTTQEVTCQHCHGYGDLVEGSGTQSRHYQLRKCPVCQGKGTVRQ
jgi:DnaJ-class molecular chaperone